MWLAVESFMQTWYFWLMLAVMYLTAGYYAWDLGSVEKALKDDDEEFTLLKSLFLPAVLIIEWICALLVRVMGWSDSPDK